MCSCSRRCHLLAALFQNNGSIPFLVQWPVNFNARTNLNLCQNVRIGRWRWRWRYYCCCCCCYFCCHRRQVVARRRFRLFLFLLVGTAKKRKQSHSRLGQRGFAFLLAAAAAAVVVTAVTGRHADACLTVCLPFCLPVCHSTSSIGISGGIRILVSNNRMWRLSNNYLELHGGSHGRRDKEPLMCVGRVRWRCGDR